jgi:transcriptional antiterminator RfaH
LFVAIDRMTQRWRSIQSTIGVVHLVCNGEDPAWVRDGVISGISGLRNREDEHGFVRLSLRPRFAAGDEIRVVDGIFGSCLGLFEGLADRERVAILLDMLGRKGRVVLDEGAIAAA